MSEWVKSYGEDYASEKAKAKRIKNECETSEHKKVNTEEKTGKKL